MDDKTKKGLLKLLIATDALGLILLPVASYISKVKELGSYQAANQYYIERIEEAGNAPWTALNP